MGAGGVLGRALQIRSCRGGQVLSVVDEVWSVTQAEPLLLGVSAIK